jgi:dTDP-4-dehydrorhamnose 3,5-epimerase
MKIIETQLEGVLIVEPDVHGDARGFFLESYSKRSFEAYGMAIDFIQDNHSLSVSKGTLRGLHYQLSPMAQTKLVRVLSGAIYDVAVDIRIGSPNFGKWVGVTLSASNRRQLFVPKGFAHGFCTLESNTQVAYKVDNYYSPEHDRGIAWDDPDLAIAWPTDVPYLSDKDMRHPRLANIHRQQAEKEVLR